MTLNYRYAWFICLILSAFLIQSCKTAKNNEVSFGGAFQGPINQKSINTLVSPEVVPVQDMTAETPYEEFSNTSNTKITPQKLSKLFLKSESKLKLAKSIATQRQNKLMKHGNQDAEKGAMIFMAIMVVILLVGLLFLLKMIMNIGGLGFGAIILILGLTFLLFLWIAIAN